MEDTKVIVTGGKGFIGSHLVHELHRLGADVRIVDSGIGTQKRVLPSKVKIHEIDVCDTKSMIPLFEDVEYVFHLAAIPNVSYSIEHPKETHRVNVEGTLSVLEAAQQSGVRRVVFSSSSAVYGNQGEVQLHEKLSVTPESPYGLQKYMSELLCRMWSELYQLPTVSLRYFNVYGPGLDPEGEYALVIGRFLKLRQADKALTIVGDGEQTRDFIHVQDVVRANILAATSSNVGNGEVVNVGAECNTSINELAKHFGGPIEHIPPRIEIKHSRADINTAKKLLGWEPQIRLKEGLDELKELFGV